MANGEIKASFIMEFSINDRLNCPNHFVLSIWSNVESVHVLKYYKMVSFRASDFSNAILQSVMKADVTLTVFGDRNAGKTTFLDALLTTISGKKRRDFVFYIYSLFDFP